MKAKFISVLILFVICFTTVTTAQTVKKFSAETELFFKELQGFFEANSNKDELMNFHKDFRKFWDSGAMPESEKAKVVDNSNAMLKKFARAYPSFLNYYTAVQSFFEKKHNLESYKQWDLAFLHLLNTKNISVVDKLTKQTTELLTNNVLYSSSSVVWKVLQAKSFTFKFDGKELALSFPASDIICQSLQNEMMILEANGVYYPYSNTWKGTGGKVAWERSGFNREEVFASLQKYNIDMTKNSYEADSVWFINSNYYDKKILGKIEDRVIVVKDLEKVNYPKFQSYQNIFVLKNVFPGINYKGGFSMSGSQFIGSGTPAMPATLTFYRADTVRVFTRALSYVFKNEGVVSEDCAVSIFILGDSIYHPGLAFKYEIAKRQVTLMRFENAANLSRSPFFNTYHMIDMDVPQLTWKIDSPEMVFGSLEGTTINKAMFESANYFRESRYGEIGGGDAMHPLLGLKKIATQLNTQTFSLSDFAKYMRMPPVEAKHMCLTLSFKGLIIYDKENELITIKPRTYQYLDARVGKIDYDVIQFNSEHDVRGLHNARLNLDSKELNLVGVKQIQVSDSKNVVFFPRGSQVIMSKNRNFRFDGVIKAGYFTYYGRGFDFNYENFKIGLLNVDSLGISVEKFTKNQNGTTDFVNLKNVIENITGDIFIDMPNNKSSVKKSPKYPEFNSKEHSFVYYDYAQIYNKVYDRERFKFKVDPFILDSLNNIVTQNLGFEGELQSANIFAPIKERLVVQKDYSLGFIRKTNTNGLALYGGKGIFTDTITLNFKGLRGFGTIDLLNSHAKSSRGFTFFPDSTNGFAEKYEVKKQQAVGGAVGYPDAQGSDVIVHWQPYKDKWVSKQTKTDFKLYDGTTTLTGGLVFTSKGLEGFGKYIFSEAQITSNTFKFKEREVLADTSSFELVSKTDALEEMAFRTNNVHSKVNFDTKKATFTANDTLTVVQMPKNKYICYLKNFTWDLQTKAIELGKSDFAGAANINNSIHLYSVHPRQDTLNFKAAYATYDLKNNLIYAKKVFFIDVADSRIVPHQDSTVIVYLDARVSPISNAVMYADRINKFHKIYNASFDIKGKLDFTGTGTLDYVDEIKTRQTIALSNIGVDSLYRTVASGAIAQDANFKLSPVFSYYGDVKLSAWRKHLTFDGQLLLSHACAATPIWYKFKSEIDADEIFVPIEVQTDPANPAVTIGTSMYVANYPTSIYTAILSGKLFADDVPLVDAKGYIFYDKKSKRYKLGSREKILNDQLEGNYVTYHKDFCNVTGEGKFNFGLDLGQVKQQSFGTVNQNIKSNKITFETFSTIDFFFDPKLLQIIADTVLARVELVGVDMTKNSFKRNITEVLGYEKGNALYNEIQQFGNVKKMPDEFVHTFTFSQLDLKWDTTASAYRSVGQIGIHSINGTIVNKMVTGYLEYAKLYAGDMFTFYFQLDKEKWYFFHYSKGEMQFISSENAINVGIEAIKEAKRTKPVGKKETPYLYTTASEPFKNLFVDMMKSGKGYTNIMPSKPPTAKPEPKEEKEKTEEVEKEEKSTEDAEEKTGDKHAGKEEKATEKSEKPEKPAAEEEELSPAEKKQLEKEAKLQKKLEEQEKAAEAKEKAESDEEEQPAKKKKGKASDEESEE